MTLWEHLICEQCDEEMEDAQESQEMLETVYRCPKCGIKVTLKYVEDYDEE